MFWFIYQLHRSWHSIYQTMTTPIGVRQIMPDMNHWRNGHVSSAKLSLRKCSTENSPLRRTIYSLGSNPLGNIKLCVKAFTFAISKGVFSKLFFCSGTLIKIYTKTNYVGNITLFMITTSKLRAKNNLV